MDQQTVPANGLFRAEAVNAQTGDRWGRPVGLLPVAWPIITGFLVIFVVSVIVFISTASFSRREMVRGVLRPTLAEARVFATDAGTLTKLYAEFGQIVEAGDILAEVATLRQIDGDTNVSAEMVSNLIQEGRSLTERRTAVQHTSTLTRQRLNIDLESTNRDQAGLAEALDLTNRRVAIAEERFESSKRLAAEGAASKEEGRLREDFLISQRQQALDLKARIAQSEERAQTLRVDIDRIDQDLARDLSDIDQRLAQVDAQIARAKGEAGFVLKAPVAGRVAALQIAAGERVDPSQPVLTILPQNAQLTAEVYIPTRAIAFVEPGQSVRLQYDALPYLKFGSAKGTVLTVSQTTFTPQELRTQMMIKEPVYRVAIALDKQYMMAMGKQVQLQPGMEMSADIVLEKRKLVEWLFEPLIAASMRMQEQP